ncbi:MAG: putative phosphorylase, family 1 [Bryobacterales bacterium]|nr:putative phosphorylase, family 1 [Bryobacterales bacterium]
MTAPVVFVAADRRECQAWAGKWDGVHALQLPVYWAVGGTWQGRDVVAVANGAGSHRAMAGVAAIGHLKPHAIVSVGTCGALDSSLRIGDIFVPGEIRTDGEIWPVLMPAGPVALTGALVSVDRIAASAAEKSDLRSTGALAVEMEAGGVARASHGLGVPFYCVRAVSDLANEDFANDFNKILMPDGRFKVPVLLLNALARPLTRIPELARLAQRTALASKNMGEFLALCRF